MPADGRRVEGDWEFFYSGWTIEDTLPAVIRQNLQEDITLLAKYTRSGATKDNMFPADRRGKLNA